MGERVSLAGAVGVAAAVTLLMSGAAFAAGFAGGRITASTAGTDAAADVPASLGRADEPTLPAPAEEPAAPTVDLQVHADGCGVIRPELAAEPDGLGWSVRDQAGFEVLQRNALGETRYRYFGSGTYTVALVAWDGQAYSPVSDTVTISC